ncbi:MAG: hypothetical protein JNM94_13070 [Phycisphaerae bacterium]|nr:hypothetical protein [Phycisphaerae bacterium]
MKTRTFAIAATLAAVMLGSAAHAASLSMTFTGLGPNKTIKANFNGGRSFNQGNAGGWTNYAAGRMQWVDQYGRNLTTYCTQIKETISNGQTVNYTLTSVANVPDPAPGAMGAIKAQLIGDLYRRFYSTVKSSANANLHSAFQLAIWEISHENLTAADANGAKAQLDVFVGAMSADKTHNATMTVGNLAMSLIAALGTDDGFRGIGGGLVGLTHSTAQDQLLVVPIPAPLAMAAAGLFGVAAWRRRRSK